MEKCEKEHHCIVCAVTYVCGKFKETHQLVKNELLTKNPRVELIRTDAVRKKISSYVRQ